MKKCLSIAIFTLFYITPNISSIEVLKCQGNVIYDKKTDIIRDRLDLIYAIGMHESRCDPNIINKSEGARGFLQIRPTCVDEANRLLGKEVFDTIDCYSVSKSIMIFSIIQDHYNPKWNKEVAAKLWNGGPQWYKKEGVKNYWLNVKKYLKKY